MLPTIKIHNPTGVVILKEDPKANGFDLKQVKKLAMGVKANKMLEHKLILRSTDLKALKEAYFSAYTMVPAAGGVVFNEKDEVLLIFRRGSWDLPKGKFEKGETKKQTALREVIEETGIKKLKVLGKVALKDSDAHCTYHTYPYRRGMAIKPSYWYVMKAKSQKLIPQTKEGIKEAKWVKQKHLGKYKKNMFSNIIDVLDAVCGGKKIKYKRINGKAVMPVLK